METGRDRPGTAEGTAAVADFQVEVLLSIPAGVVPAFAVAAEVVVIGRVGAVRVEADSLETPGAGRVVALDGLEAGDPGGREVEVGAEVELKDDNFKAPVRSRTSEILR